MTSSGTMPLRLSAMRTRNVASERQNENSFTGRLPCGRIGLVCFLPGFIAEIVMAASISYYADGREEMAATLAAKQDRQAGGRQ